MQLKTILLALFTLSLDAVSGAALKKPSATIERKDADFASVRTRLVKDHSGKKGDPKDKYFHESTFHPHYDGRFADRPLSYDDRRTHLTSLMQTYLSTMNDIGAETWIMHGSLLGWFWNRKIMPWDSDVDVQVSEQSMEHLANYYNMTIHHYKLPGAAEGRDYMLEINPHWTNGSVTDRLNMIDARWVDTETGLFIDITTLRRNLTAEALGHEGYMMCKDKHHYNYTDIFPLRESVFEDTPVKIPYAYTDLLVEEYGTKSLIKKDFENHHFDQETMEWVRVRKTSNRPTSNRPSAKKGAGSNRVAVANNAASVAAAKAREDAINARLNTVVTEEKTTVKQGGSPPPPSLP